MDIDKFVDVDFKEDDKIKNRVINGEPLFYTTTQVSEMLKEEPSCIRYWSKRFENLLDIEMSNRNKQYKKSDIEKLKFIQKLIREDGLTLQQVESYCQTKGFRMKDIENAVLDVNNPLAIQAFISAVTVELDKKLSNFAETIFKEMDEKYKGHELKQQEINDKLHENIVTTVDEVVSEKLDIKLNKFKSYIDEKEIEAKDRDLAMINLMRTNMEKKKSENEKKKHAGFFNRLFKGKD